MKVLQIFNRYTHVGGEELAVAQIREQLEARHEVREIIFDSRDWAARRGWSERLRQPFLMAWNGEAIREVRELVEDFRPDLILLHNLMPVGSTGLYVYLARCGVPVVHFIHNFRPFSVNGYCWAAGQLQPAGLRKNFLPEIFAGAWQESRIRTAWYALQLWFLHASRTFNRIQGWIAISEFMGETFVRCGIPKERVRVISHSWEPHCTEEDLAAGRHFPEDPCFLFLGRLAEEKGLRVLLDAWEIHEAEGRPGQLVIAGNGPLAEEVRVRCEALKRARCLPFVSGEEKLDLLRNCTALVVPSIWWEPLGLVIFEAFDFGKPVLAARSGGIVDHVQHAVNGWVHEPGDSKMLAAHLAEAAGDRETCERLGLRGRAAMRERSRGRWLEEFEAFASDLLKRPGVPAAAAPGEAEPSPALLVRTVDPADPADPAKPLSIAIYLADQNPNLGRSLGISRMTEVVIDELVTRKELSLTGLASRSSIRMPAGSKSVVVPWTTRNRLSRVITDHLHPVWLFGKQPDLWYFPKGFLPRLHRACSPSVVTIHDTIIQYDEDRYPEWRSSMEYGYWAKMLKHTLRNADFILTVSEASRSQIQAFMERHRIPRKEIVVTFEPCVYEALPQPVEPPKENYVIHLASAEPHKRTSHLVRWWHEAEAQKRDMPMLHLIGTVPDEVAHLLASSRSIVKSPFLEESALQAAYCRARALILPSEIEGFGLPALEAYYLGTPVCFVTGTSVEEVLCVATRKGGFSLGDPNTLYSALDEVMAMTPEEVRACGLKLRETYAAAKIADRMVAVFQRVARQHADR